MPGRLGKTEVRLGTRFTVDGDADAAFARAEVYLRAARYEVGRAPGQLTATRGDPATTMLALSPRGWGVTVSVTLNPRDGALEASTVFVVDTTGQSPSRSERAFWRQEVLGLERALGGGDPSVAENDRLARRSVWTNLLSIPALFGAALAPIAAVAWRFRDVRPEEPWLVPCCSAPASAGSS